MRKLKKKKKEKEMGVRLRERERERERDFEGDGQRLQFLTRGEFWGSLRDLRKLCMWVFGVFNIFPKEICFRV